MKNRIKVEHVGILNSTEVGSLGEKLIEIVGMGASMAVWTTLATVIALIACGVW